MSSIADSKLKYFFPSILDTFFIVILIYILVIDSGAHILRDADTGFHIMIGRYILEHGTVPAVDIFSYTVPGQDWVAFSWGTGLIFAILEKFTHLNGIVFFSTALVLATLFILYRLLMYWKVNFFAIAISMIVLTYLSTVHWLARPHLFTIFFTAATFCLLEMGKENKKYYYFIPLIMLIWVNCHPGFISGFFLLTLYFTGNIIETLINKNNENKTVYLHRVKAIAIIGIVSFIATLANPYGLKLYHYIYKTLTSSWIVNATLEYYSPDFHGTVAVIVYAFVIAGLILLSFNSKEKNLDVSVILVLLLWTHLSLFAIRNIAIFGVIAAPCLALVIQKNLDLLNFEWIKNIDLRLTDTEKNLKYHTWLILLMIIFAISLANNGYFFNKKLLDCHFSDKLIPVKALAYFESNPIEGNMLNQDNWGGYIIYAYPDIKVFMDGRLDMYQEAFLNQYQKIINLRPGGKANLDKYKVKWILFANNTLFNNYLDNSKEWKTYYKDPLATIFVRNNE